jgi:hypothetical protein
MPKSLRKIEPNRRNARQSTGPKTPEGKARSSQNAIDHGCASQAILLHNESPTLLASLRQSLLDHFQPANPVEQQLVLDLVAARWRTFRTWAHESATLDLAIDASAPEIEKLVQQPDLPTRLAFGFDKMAKSSPSLELLHRYETRYHRQFYRALAALNARRGAPASPSPGTPALSQPLPPNNPEPAKPAPENPESPASPAYKPNPILLAAAVLLACLLSILHPAAPGAQAPAAQPQFSAKRTQISGQAVENAPPLPPATALPARALGL